MRGPDVHRYLDFRAFLRDWFAARREADPRFSRRAFARLAGKSSPGLLAEVMDGDRQLTPAMVEAFAGAMGLGRAEADFFAALVRLAQATSTTERNEAWDRISASRHFREARRIEGASVEYLSNWWFPVVRELAQRPDFRADPAWIARRIRPPISEGQARKALETLQALELLVPHPERGLAPAEGVVATPHEVAGLAVHNYHRGMLELAIESMERFPPEERHLVAATLSVPRALVPALKRELDALQERVLDLSDRLSDPPEQVMQVHLVLFPLSDALGDGP